MGVWKALQSSTIHMSKWLKAAPQPFQSSALILSDNIERLSAINHENQEQDLESYKPWSGIDLEISLIPPPHFPEKKTHAQEGKMTSQRSYI